MHLYIITRGIKHAVDRFITELQGKYVPFKWKSPTDTELKDYMVQLGVRPIQLWEIVFPEEQKDVVLHTILGKEPSMPNKKFEKYISWIRKILGIEEIPEYKKDTFLPLCKTDVGVVGIGIKKDEFHLDGYEGL